MSGRPHRTTITLAYDDEARARLVETCLARDVGEIDDERSVTRVERTGPRVELTIEAADLVALRAAGNTWLTLAGVAERTADATETVPF